MSCKKCDEEELCEECPEWIFTLADLLMCMMGLFVLMWVLKPDGAGGASGAGAVEAEEERQVEVIASIREKFGYVPDSDSHDPIDLFLLKKEMERQARNGPGERGNTKRAPDGAEGTEHEVTTIRPGQHYTKGGAVGFAAGEHIVSLGAIDLIDQIAEEIKGHRNIIMVRGHAALDDGGDDDEKMMLSLRRAEQVARLLVERGVSRDVIRVQGSGTYEPIRRQAYFDDTPTTNRRVEIEVTDQLVRDRQAEELTTPVDGTRPLPNKPASIEE
ncbi:MAG: OmpA family protein [Planctomycetota bacterium]